MGDRAKELYISVFLGLMATVGIVITLLQYSREQ